MSLSSFIYNNPMVKASPRIKLLFLFMWFAWSSILVGGYQFTQNIISVRKLLEIPYFASSWKYCVFGHNIKGALSRVYEISMFSPFLAIFNTPINITVCWYVEILLRSSGDADWILLECLLGPFPRFQNVCKERFIFNVKNCYKK